ncbi:ABC transporter ATP-binding protein [Noviherbaspirillum sp.]|uniref:ABC transporter ATP-binding protein n=1 Tax=Noviherbaspirillum sp. TaxID=1926288 RepID=UPI002B492813|nr:ABC transporter ATP-binding protein [Noviherbaspirillum sp.]HJV83345.1 ABC transporter ATP-binding protein [Noviherbaspirillum sp.]
MKPLLQLEGVTAGYGPTVIIEDLTLGLEAGGVLALLGRNGVGKSTLMKTLVGQTRLHRGNLQLRGQSIAALPSHRRALAGIGYVPQERDIFRSLTIEENLRIAARPGRWTVDAVYEMFPNLAGRRTNYGDQVSGGEQQMLAIGRALMGNPDLLLLDEPMEGLAPVIVDQILNALERLRGAGLAIILVEQYVHLALDFAPRTVVLDRGRVVYDGKSSKLAGNAELMASCLGVSGGTGVHAHA